MASINRQWPAWHPNQELTAYDLLGLEDYLLSGTAIATGCGHGVDSFDLTSVRVDASVARELGGQEQGDLVEVLVSALRGLTPAREPVSIGEGNSITTPLLVGSTPHVRFDLWIDVNARIPQSAPAEREDEGPSDRPQKFTLRAPLAYQNPSVKPGDHEHSLYLGRFELQKRATALQIVDRPLTTRLGALKPYDSSWREWVEPLRKRLDRTLQLAAEQAEGGGWRASALAAAVGELVFMWPSLPLPLLARRLKYISWLIRASAIASVPPADPAAIDSFTVPEGNDVPKELAALLPEEQVRVEIPSAGSPWRQSLEAVLLALRASGGVDYRAPLAEIAVWADEVARPSPPDPSGLASDVEALLNTQVFSTSADIWSRTVVLLTLARVDAPQAAYSRFPALTSLLGGRPVAERAGEALSQLYSGEAATKRAGPIAFYWLARVAQSISLTPNAATGNYLALIRTTSAKRVQNAPSDRVIRFLFDHVARQSGAGEADVRFQPPVAGRILSDSRNHRGAYADERRVTLVGPSGAGKTTLLRQLCLAVAEVAARPLGVSLKYESTGRAPDSVGEIVTTAKGEVRSASGRSTILRIDDWPGSLLVASRGQKSSRHQSDLYTAFDQNIRDTHLLVITIDPTTALTAPPDTMDSLVAVLNSLTTSATGAMVAFAYTKADEYGVISPNALRILQGPQVQQFHSYSKTGAQAEWKRIAEGKRLGVSVDPQPEDGLKAVIGGRQYEWSATRSRILEQTRPIWDKLLTLAQPAPLMNGYFIAAEPRDPLLQPWANRGLIQLLGDFLGHVRL